MLYQHVGSIGVGRQRRGVKHANHCLSCCKRPAYRFVFILFYFLAVTMAGGRVRSFVQMGDYQLRMRGSVVSRSAHRVRHSRGSCIACPLLSGSGHTGKNIEQFDAVHPHTRMSASQAVRSRMDEAPPSRDSQNTSRRFALGAWDVCLVGENPT